MNVESKQVRAVGDENLADDSSYIYKPEARVPNAVPDIDSIIFKCYEEGLSAKEAVQRCHSSGAKNVGLERVEEKYRELRTLAARHRTKDRAGDE